MPAGNADVLRELAISIDGAGLHLCEADDALDTWQDEAEAAVSTIYRLLLEWGDGAHAAGTIERGTLWLALRDYAVEHGLEAIVRPHLEAATHRYLAEVAGPRPIGSHAEAGAGGRAVTDGRRRVGPTPHLRHTITQSSLPTPHLPPISSE